MNATETPGGPGIPAGWYDDPSGPGLRWWDGDAWTEHVHTAESAAAAAGGTTATGGGESEVPPPELVKLRESIRSRGAKGVGIVLGAVVLVIVVVALLLSGGSNNDSGTFEPGANPGAGQITPAAAKAAEAQIKVLRKQLKAEHLPKAEKKALEAQLKELEKAAASDKGAPQSGSAKAKSGNGKSTAPAKKKKASSGEEGN